MTSIRRMLTALAMLVILTHGAVASASFSSSAMSIEGTATLEGDARALFALATGAPFTWTLTAEHVIVDRTSMPWREVADPRGGALVQKIDNESARREVLTFTDATLRSGDAEEGAGILVLSDDARVTGVTLSRMSFAPVTDARFLQDEADVPEDAPPLEIRHTVPGEHVLARVQDGTFTLEGTLTLQLFGPDYALESAEGAYAGRTGYDETRAVAAYKEGQIERQVLTLKGARLEIQSPGEVQLLSASPRVAFQGALSADAPEGDFPLPLPSPDGATWAGQGALELGLQGGRLLVDAPEALRATGTAVTPRAPSLVPVAAGAVALVAGVLALRRRRREDDDPLALALLAMEDRRWEDALPHVERALQRSPGDAKLLVDRALCLEETGRLSEARDGYEAALRAEPFNAETHYYYARTLARLRNSTAALAHLGRALSLDARLAELARREPSFAPFRDHPQFLGLFD